jgi:hypothetical protein
VRFLERLFRCGPTADSLYGVLESRRVRRNHTTSCAAASRCAGGSFRLTRADGWPLKLAPPAARCCASVGPRGSGPTWRGS